MLLSYFKKAIHLGCLFYCFNSYAQDVTLTESNHLNYEQLLKGNFEHIQTLPTNHFDQYVFLYQSALQQLLLENISQEDFEEIFDTVFESIKNMDSSSPYKLYYEAETRLLAGIVYYKNKEQLDAGWQIRQSYKAIQRNYTLFPEFDLNLKTLGVLQLTLGAIPEKYQWILSVAGMKGSIAEGAKNLSSVKSDNIFKNESLYLLALTYSYVLGNTSKAIEIIESVHGNNPLLTLIKMSLLAKNNQGEEVIQLALSVPLLSNIPQQFYLTAEAYLQKGDYTVASNFYQKFISNHVGNTNRQDALFKMALCAHFLNDEEQREYYLSEALKLEPHSASDKNALSLIHEIETLNYEMLKLRLAIDGGFYNRAELLIGSIDVFTKKDSVELIYRQARLFHNINRLTEAITLYQTTIKKSEKSKWYFAPNSALNLGFINENQGNLNKAIEYYELAQSYNQHIYKNSIDSKAEAGINRIKDLLND